MDVGKMIFMIVFFSLELVSWVITHLMCDFKYFWCKGKCSSCHNWRCRYFDKGDRNNV